ASWLLARAARAREAGTLRLLTELQAEIRSAASAGDWPLQIGPLPASRAGIGDLIVWDLLGVEPVIMTATPAAIVSKHERILQQAFQAEERVVRARAL